MKHRLRDSLLRPAARIGRRQRDGGNTVLILQPDHLGDILLSQPAVRLIRKQHPTQRLVAAVGPWSETIAKMTWPVDDVLTIDYPGFTRKSTGNTPISPYLQLRDSAKRLRELEVATAYVLRPDAWWAAWLASLVTGGPVVTSDDPRVAPFGTVRTQIRSDVHTSVRAIRIAAHGWTTAKVGAIEPEAHPLSIPKQPEAEVRVRDFLQAQGVPDDYAVIHPGAGAEVKRWLSDRWRFVASELVSAGLSVLVTGSEAEVELARSVVDRLDGAISVAGQTPLPVLIEILRGARLVLGPDSGPLHLAVACGTPTVHLYGPSDPGRYGPWGPPTRHRVIQSRWSCPSCGDLSPNRQEGCGCMLAIEADAVLEAAHELRRDYADR